jgi:tetratricopeptide (TPR) repeat protein
MRTTQNPTDRIGRLLAAVCLVAALAGCTPPEQKALEDGSRLLAAGKTAEALVQLQDAQKRIEGHPNLKTNLVVVGKLYNQLGLAHQILSKNKTGAAKTGELREAKKWFDLAIEKGGQGSRIQAYENRAWLHLEAEEWEEAAKVFGSLFITINDTKSTNQVFDLWLEKGTAEYGAGRIAEAEKSFNKIPNDARAQNNLGNIAWKQKRNAVAADHFEQAINLDEKNTTALRNLGAVRQELKQYPEALEAYRAYHGLVPADSDIRDLVESLEEYLKPDPIPEPEPEPEPVAQVEPEPEPKEEVKPEPVVAEAIPEEPEPEPVVIVEPPTEEPEPEPVAPEPEVVTVVEPEPLPVPEAKPEEAVTPAEPSEPEPAPVITQVEPAKPAKDWKQRLNPKNWFGDDDEETTAKPSEPAPETEFGQAETSTEPKSGKDWKQRMNPVSWFKSDDEETTAKPKKTKSQISWRSNTPVPTTPLPSPKPLASASTNAVKVASVLPSAVAFPRYKYLNPALPNSGDRQVARTYFDDGDGAQKREEWQRAKAAYLEASKADPAWFDARFELGQAAYYTGDTDLALQSFEHALAIKPNDGPARFNFAKSLVQGNYYAAAAHELETFLQFDPDNAQAHFEAGRLYAQELNDVARAAVHYKRVIGLKPGHPQAVTIRYWLIRNKTN